MPNKKYGFTLVEIMVAIFIGSIVMTAVYSIWSKVSADINYSTTRQRLQNEIRKVSNYLQKDLRSIKADSFTIKGSPTESSFEIEFAKFEETEDGKLAEESVATISYKLANNILTRTDTKTGMSNLLSAHLDTMSMETCEDEGGNSSDSESYKLYKAGREARLNVAIVGKTIIPGTCRDMYHVERTSIVMRDEYYKNVNKTYKSNYQLKDLENDKIIVNDTSQDALFFAGEGFTEEALSQLDTKQLNELKKNQKEMLDQIADQMDNINKSIDDTDTGESGWSKFCDWCNIFSDSEGEKVRDLRSKIAKAKTKEDTEKYVTELREYAMAKEDEYRNNSMGNVTASYGSATNMSYSQLCSKVKQEKPLTDDEKTLKEMFEKAYDAKMQDRNTMGAFNKSKEDGKATDADKPETQEDRLKQKVTSNDLPGVSDTDIKAINDKNDAILQIYGQVNIDSWMGEYGDEKDDTYSIYTAAKSIVTSGESKISMFDRKKTAEDNIELIDKVIGQKS